MQRLEPPIRSLRLLRVIAEGHGLVQAAEKIGRVRQKMSHCGFAALPVAMVNTEPIGKDEWMAIVPANRFEVPTQIKLERLARHRFLLSGGVVRITSTGFSRKLRYHCLTICWYARWIPFRRWWRKDSELVWCQA